MWLFFALLTPLFWSVVHVMDAYCVERIFEKSWFGVIIGSLASLVVFIPLLIVAPFVSWEIPTTKILIFALTAGSLIQISQAFYFHALDYSEAGIVAAYWNIVPALLPIASFILLKEELYIQQYIGIIVLIFASSSMFLLDTKTLMRSHAFVFMIIASILQVGAFLLEKAVFESTSFASGYALITIGLIITGCLPLSLRKIRFIFMRNVKKLWHIKEIFIGIEIANLCALFTTQMAVNLGIPSLVAAVESTIPAYTFALSLLLLFFPITRKYGDPLARNHLPFKIINVGFMAIGVFLLA